MKKRTKTNYLVLVVFRLYVNSTQHLTQA